MHTYYILKTGSFEAFSHSRLNKFFEKGWGFDKLYDTLFVKPIVWLSVIDKMIYRFVEHRFSQAGTFINQATKAKNQNGKLRWYFYKSLSVLRSS